MTEPVSWTVVVSASYRPRPLTQAQTEFKQNNIKLEPLKKTQNNKIENVTIWVGLGLTWTVVVSASYRPRPLTTAFKSRIQHLNIIMDNSEF